MNRTLISLLVCLCAAWPLRGEEAFEAQIRPLLEQYCYRCHGGGAKIKGGVNLAQFKELAAAHRDPKLWENVLKQLREREMPPEGKPQPSLEERDRLVAWIENFLENLDSNDVPRDPGRVVLHRLSRAEYNNTIRDLLGVDSRPADDFPSDGAGGGGFDNNADTLFLPPILMERFLAAAGEVLDQAGPQRLLIARPGAGMSEERAARQILDFFAMRAFRRPVEAIELEPLLKLFRSARQAGESFEASIKQSLRAVLVSPFFLYRVERDQSISGPYRISDYELASRLSYFLWSSMPDEALFELAAKNQLHEPEVLRETVRRMLNDPKADAFAEEFAGQWLGIDRLATAAQPDPNAFKAYTVELQHDLCREPVEFFRHLIRENRSVLELLDADYAWLNARLASHYGIEGVEGDAFRRVALTNHQRGGVLGMGAVLTLTSYPLRTSPVLRGKWVLEEILGTPPPPPPPMVKSLPKTDKVRDGLTFRQQLEQHRSNPNCASCHRKMDPLGFGLENFDPIGRWRTEIGGQPIDASGELGKGETFDGPVELKRMLLARKDLFLKNFVEKMLAYALGRGLEYYDAPTVKAITEAVAKDGFRSQRAILEIVNSFPFQYRRNSSPASEQTRSN